MYHFNTVLPPMMTFAQPCRSTCTHSMLRPEVPRLLRMDRISMEGQKGSKYIIRHDFSSMVVGLSYLGCRWSCIMISHNGQIHRCMSHVL